MKLPTKILRYAQDDKLDNLSQGFTCILLDFLPYSGMIYLRNYVRRLQNEK